MTTYKPIRLDDPIDPDISDRHLIDLMVTAVEHMGYGSFSWTEAIDHATDVVVHQLDLSMESKQEFARLAPSERVGHYVVKHGGTVTVHDKEHDTEHTYCGSFDRTLLVKAVERWARHRSLSPQSVCEFTYTDVIDADAVVQLAALGEVVFG